jgi:hypothetical protein
MSKKNLENRIQNLKEQADKQLELKAIEIYRRYDNDLSKIVECGSIL